LITVGTKTFFSFNQSSTAREITARENNPTRRHVLPIIIKALLCMVQGPTLGLRFDNQHNIPRVWLFFVDINLSVKLLILIGHLLISIY
jgi:hypothetical protein